MKAPVVFIFFNRLKPTALSFERIRQFKPDTLLLISDGPRPNREGEAACVAQTRALVEAMIDWPCTLHKNYSEYNLGCRKRILSGLDWTFGLVERAIILEDDCLAAPSFFGFCTELLERYESDTRIMHIGGCNLAHRYTQQQASYWYTHHAWIWGWATWRRAWLLNDPMMNTWDTQRSATKRSFASNWEAQYWMAEWERVAENIEKATTWGFPWMFTCRKNGISILPSCNLIKNLGFGTDSTHTSEELLHLQLALGVVKTIISPDAVSTSAYRDEMITRVYLNEDRGLLANLKSRLRILKKWVKDR